MVELLSPNGSDESPKKSVTADDVEKNADSVLEPDDGSNAAGGKSPATAPPTPRSRIMATSTKSKDDSKTKSNGASDAERNRLAEARAKNLDLAISQIQKDYGETAIMRLGGEERIDIDAIPTGNLLIDRALGVGGFPRGRIVEVFGPESSGKTTLTLTVIAQAQKAGGLAASS